MIAIESNWDKILEILRTGKKSNRFFSIATVDAQGSSHVTPIGHVFFANDSTGYYFDAYSKVMPRNFETNKSIYLMAVNSSPVYWIKSLFLGKFKTSPAVGVFGEVSEPREATVEEISKLEGSIRMASKLKGHNLLWSDLKIVSDMKFTSFSPAIYPEMCEGLW